MPSLLERQVSALRESVRPGGRWDRLASGEMGEGEKPETCALCMIAEENERENGGACPVCPLQLAGEWCDNKKGVYHHWVDAHDAIRYNDDDDISSHHAYNDPTIVALAREMKALLEGLLVEYEHVLELERAHPVKEGEICGYPVVKTTNAPLVFNARGVTTSQEPCCDPKARKPSFCELLAESDEDWTAPTKPDACACSDCGGGSDGVHKQEVRAQDDTIVSFCINPGKDAPAIRLCPRACADAALVVNSATTDREPCCDRVPGPEDIPDETGVSARDRAADEKWTCPHCGGTKGTWFDRTVSEDGSMADVCEDCGKDVGESPEHYARADAVAGAHDALVVHLEEMSDVGAECAPLVVEAYRKWKEARDADHEH